MNLYFVPSNDVQVKTPEENASVRSSQLTMKRGEVQLKVSTLFVSTAD